MFVVIGARDFSPEITVHLIGTEVPCFDKVPPPQIPIYRDEAGFFQNVADISIACKIFGAQVADMGLTSPRGMGMLNTYHERHSPQHCYVHPGSLSRE